MASINYRLSLIILGIVGFILCGMAVSEKIEVCWRNVRSDCIELKCPIGMDYNELLCYDNCNKGYVGHGPVCWEDCPKGYDDTGALCHRWLYVISADNDDCPWYDICGLTFARGCSKCPENQDFINDGCTCRRPPSTLTRASYGRGVGTLREWLVYKARNEGKTKERFCPCNDGYIRDYNAGTDLFCWQECPKDFPTAESGICTKTGELRDPAVQEAGKFLARFTSGVVASGRFDKMQGKPWQRTLLDELVQEEISRNVNFTQFKVVRCRMPDENLMSNYYEMLLRYYYSEN